MRGHARLLLNHEHRCRLYVVGRRTVLARDIATLFPRRRSLVVVPAGLLIDPDSTTGATRALARLGRGFRAHLVATVLLAVGSTKVLDGLLRGGTLWRALLRLVTLPQA